MFVPPQFPLSMNIWRMGIPYVFADRLFFDIVPCQLRWWGQEIKPFTGNIFTEGISAGSIAVLCPAGTDIRDESCGGGADLVEVPDASGRFYLVGYADDVAKGFANEYRCALLLKVFGENLPNFVGFPLWPTPIP